jgi:diguanylate cyclase (GGDEF)-like protein
MPKDSDRISAGPSDPATRTQQLRTIIDIQSMLVSVEFDLSSFLRIVVEHVQQLTNASGAVIELVEDTDMVYGAASGTLAPHVGFRLPRANTLSGLCVQTRQILQSVDTSLDPRVDAVTCRKIGAASMIVVPLLRLGETIGVLKVVSTVSHAFTEQECQTLGLMAGLLGAALGQQMEIEMRQQLEKRLQFMAQNDGLTGLPNRSLFDDRLAQALRRTHRTQGVLAVMYIDIDFFKSVNDQYGHAVGDAVLQIFAARASAVIRSADTLARLGGDEFALIAENLRTYEDAENIAAKLIAATREAIVLQDQQQLNISVSIGIALAFEVTAESIALLRQADVALYEAKKAGRNCFRRAPN